MRKKNDKHVSLLALQFRLNLTHKFYVIITNCLVIADDDKEKVIPKQN